MNNLQTILLGLLAIIFCLSIPVSAQPDQVLWYDRPAEHFEESLVLGNGRMGASVFGGVETDKIYLNDITLWSGGPVDPYMNPDAHTHLPAVREALKNEQYQLADSLNRKIQGSFSQSYAPLGTMFLNFRHTGNTENYRRTLDLASGISTVSYEMAGTTFKREYFISHPDQVMAIRLSSSKKRAIDCSLKFESLLKLQTKKEAGLFVAQGYAPYHAEPSYRRDVPDPIRFDPNQGTRFTSLFKISNTDGKVSITDSTLELKGCSEAIILISIATSFNGFDKNPVTDGRDHQKIAKNHLQRAEGKNYQTLKQAHLADHSSLYDRVKMQLGKSDAPDLPTDQRLKRYSKGQPDKDLEILYFNFGRYLLIASSRTEKVPANLQGIWNPYIRPPWSSNYTININAQENYWLAETANLSELHQPLLGFIENVATTGAITAKTFYGTGGWAACHNSDIWAMSNPVGDFGQGNPNWANWNMGGVWLATHLWEHFAFSRDLNYLKTKAYPLLKGATQFCLDWMVKDEEGHWITSPGTSPENLYVTPTGYKGATLYGATADLAMIRELFDQFILASEALGINDEFVKQTAEARKYLHPYRIGSKGHLQEWYHDWEDADPQHRHQSHLFGLYPGNHIDPEKTPELAEACRKTLEIKGDESTGWSKGWRINLWARLWDGNRAYKMYQELLRYVEPDGLRANYTNGGGTYPNLFDAHPPFQIDGNFGGAAAVIEMLLQSDENTIYLLPALPDAWASGSISGICARGGYELALEWENNVLTKTTVLAKSPGKTRMVFGDQEKEISLKKGESLTVKW
jgi:alpha-L-fucosidase 2